MFKRILVPVDGSSTSALGLKTAIRMARSGEAALTLLHVVDENVMLTSGEFAGAAYIDRLLSDFRAGGKKIIDKAAAEATKAGLKVKTVLVENIAPRRVADIIVEQAGKARADVIVIGTHGRRGIQRVVLGSDAEEVVRSALVPVLLVRPQGRGRGK